MGPSIRQDSQKVSTLRALADRPSREGDRFGALSLYSNRQREHEHEQEQEQARQPGTPAPEVGDDRQGCHEGEPRQRHVLHEETGQVMTGQVTAPRPGRMVSGCRRQPEMVGRRTVDGSRRRDASPCAATHVAGPMTAGALNVRRRSSTTDSRRAQHRAPRPARLSSCCGSTSSTSRPRRTTTGTPEPGSFRTTHAAPLLCTEGAAWAIRPDSESLTFSGRRET